jgi:hypothetical protein
VIGVKIKEKYIRARKMKMLLRVPRNTQKRMLLPHAAAASAINERRFKVIIPKSCLTNVILRQRNVMHEVQFKTITNPILRLVG